MNWSATASPIRLLVVNLNLSAVTIFQSAGMQSCSQTPDTRSVNFVDRTTLTGSNSGYGLIGLRTVDEWIIILASHPSDIWGSDDFLSHVYIMSQSNMVLWKIPPFVNVCHQDLHLQRSFPLCFYGFPWFHMISLSSSHEFHVIFPSQVT